MSPKFIFLLKHFAQYQKQYYTILYTVERTEYNTTRVKMQLQIKPIIKDPGSQAELLRMHA